MVGLPLWSHEVRPEGEVHGRTETKIHDFCLVLCELSTDPNQFAFTYATNTSIFNHFANISEVKMVGEELQVIRLKNDFYRDGFKKMMLALGVIITAVSLLIATSFYLFFAKPSPINFATDDEWRILPPIPLEKPYLSTANLLQWVSETFSTVFNFDFLNYAKKQGAYQPYFTENGWKKYNELLNFYVPINSVLRSKSVVVGALNGGPFIVNQGLLARRYAWWVQLPVNINFSGYDRSYTQPLILQALVVRVPTLNNLSGVAIENLVIVNQKQNNTTRIPGA
jgi:intracellular multiplication protein IcmL